MASGLHPFRVKVKGEWYVYSSGDIWISPDEVPTSIRHDVYEAKDKLKVRQCIVESRPNGRTAASYLGTVTLANQAANEVTGEFTVPNRDVACLAGHPPRIHDSHRVDVVSALTSDCELSFTFGGCPHHLLYVEDEQFIDLDAKYESHASGTAVLLVKCAIARGQSTLVFRKREDHSRYVVIVGSDSPPPDMFDTLAYGDSLYGCHVTMHSMDFLCAIVFGRFDVLTPLQFSQRGISFFKVMSSVQVNWRGDWITGLTAEWGQSVRCLVGHGQQAILSLPMWMRTFGDCRAEAGVVNFYGLGTSKLGVGANEGLCIGVG